MRSCSHIDRAQVERLSQFGGGALRSEVALAGEGLAGKQRWAKELEMAFGRTNGARLQKATDEEEAKRAAERMAKAEAKAAKTAQKEATRTTKAGAKARRALAKEAKNEEQEQKTIV